MTVSVLGAGSFGTVIANIVARNGNPVGMWARDQQQIAQMAINRENKRYLPDHPLHSIVTPANNMRDTVRASDLIFVTVPSSSFRTVARALSRYIRPGTKVVSCTKGVEDTGTDFRLMSQILAEQISDCPIGVLSGPNLAEEIANSKIAGTVIASGDDELIEIVQNTLQSNRFRIYGSKDVFGVELGGALKNIYAIICGMASALELGQNAISMIITRSLAEMCRFAQAMGGNAATFLGLAGVGDLVATCTSKDSRNFRLGFILASGTSLENASAEHGKLTEGLNTMRVIYRKKNDLQLPMPLVDALYRVLVEGMDMSRAIVEIMTSARESDVEFTASLNT